MENNVMETISEVTETTKDYSKYKKAGAFGASMLLGMAAVPTAKWIKKKVTDALSKKEEPEGQEDEGTEEEVVDKEVKESKAKKKK